MIRPIASAHCAPRNSWAESNVRSLEETLAQHAYSRSTQRARAISVHSNLRVVEVRLTEGHGPGVLIIEDH